MRSGWQKSLLLLFGGGPLGGESIPAMGGPPVRWRWRSTGRLLPQHGSSKVRQGKRQSSKATLPGLLCTVTTRTRRRYRLAATGSQWSSTVTAVATVAHGTATGQHSKAIGVQARCEATVAHSRVRRGLVASHAGLYRQVARLSKATHASHGQHMRRAQDNELALLCAVMDERQL